MVISCSGSGNIDLAISPAVGVFESHPSHQYVENAKQDSAESKTSPTGSSRFPREHSFKQGELPFHRIQTEKPKAENEPTRTLSIER
jgi:hypothetical protein